MAANSFFYVTPPTKGVAFDFGIFLDSQADANVFQTNPTLADGDVVVWQDWTYLGNIDSLPVVVGGSKLVHGTLSAAEMNADEWVIVLFSDQAGGEWKDRALMIMLMEAVTPEVLVVEIDVAALADMFNTNSGETGGAAVAGSVVGEILSNVNTVAFPAGAIEYTFTITDSGTGLPIDGAEVWFATDAAYANVIWKGESDAFGIARDVNNDKPMLDAGTYYYRTQHANYGASEGTVVVS
jgi:hypothetical protein